MSSIEIRTTHIYLHADVHKSHPSQYFPLIWKIGTYIQCLFCTVSIIYCCSWRGCGRLQMNDYYSLHKCSPATCFTALYGSADIWLSGPSKYFYWVLTIILICICAAAARHLATPGSCHELVTFMTQEWCYYVTQYLNHRPFSSCLLLQWWQKHAIINGETVCLIHYLLLSRPSLRRVESVININK